MYRVMIIDDEPYILQGGVIEQWVTQQDNAGDGVSYFHVGGNVWFKEFHRGSHQDNNVRIKLDTEDYRERRKKTLENLARNIAFKVKRTRQPVALEPMNPYERRIIHSALQNEKFITTFSEGEEPYRKVVVALKKDENGEVLLKEERAEKGGRGRGGRGGRNSRGGRRRDYRGNRERRNNDNAQESESQE